MKAKVKSKQARRWHAQRDRHVRRMNDRHDRWYLHAWMRALVETLAREDISVDQKLAWLAATARRIAPAITAKRKATRTSCSATEGSNGR